MAHRRGSGRTQARVSLRPGSASSREAGFSLMETLVALLVLGIAAAGLVRAAEAHIDAIRGLERRAVAGWVAENRMAELQLPGDAATGDGVEILGMRWQVSVTERPSEDPDLRAVTVSVTATGETRPIVTLDGFVDAGTVTA